MKIVVIGCGKVGTTVVKHLSGEGHNIIVVDTDSKVVEDCINSFDVQGVCGNGATMDIQKEAGVDKADLLISVTDKDELNVFSCLVAKKLGVKQTIARVRNPEYIRQMYVLQDELGVSMFVNPELDAANEITRILRYPSALKIDSFANGKVDLAEIKIEAGSPLIGKPLTFIHEKYQTAVLICAVVRKGEVIIPKGKFSFEQDDDVYLTSSPDELTRLFKQLNIYKDKVKNAIVVGGGKITYYLAGQLEKSGIDTKIIEKKQDRCQLLSDKFSNILVLHGDGTDQALLMQEGLESTDAIISLTGMDEENIIISLFAKSKNVGKVITKVNKNTYKSIIDKVGLDTVLSPKDISTSHIIRYVRGMETSRGDDFRTLYRLVDNSVEASEFYISREAKYTNKPLKEIKTIDNTLIAAIIRNGNVIIPNGNDVIKVNDIVIVISKSQIKEIKEIF